MRDLLPLPSAQREIQGGGGRATARAAGGATQSTYAYHVAQHEILVLQRLRATATVVGTHRIAIEEDANAPTIRGFSNAWGAPKRVKFSAKLEDEPPGVVER